MPATNHAKRRRVEEIADTYGIPMRTAEQWYYSGDVAACAAERAARQKRSAELAAARGAIAKLRDLKSRIGESVEMIRQEMGIR